MNGTSSASIVTQVIHWIDFKFKSRNKHEYRLWLVQYYNLAFVPYSQPNGLNVQGLKIPTET